MSTDHLERYFPNLKQTGYRKTSDSTEHSTESYNCIAWAAGNTRRWFEPAHYPNYYWPATIPFEYSLDSYTQLFIKCGYIICEGAEAEEGYEKVALFVDSLGIPSHAARLQSSGVWTSKLGDLEDIDHDSLDAFEGSDYGTVACILKRRLLGKGTSR